MFQRISNGWGLTKQSWAVLKSDKQLIVFPVLSAGACLLVLASFAVPMMATVDWSSIGEPDGQVRGFGGPLYCGIAFGFYFANYFVMSFFNAALIGAAMRKFNGESADVRSGLAVAASRLPQLLGWALVAATVGMVLKMISERLGFVGKIVIGLLGMVWSIATYFVVPVLVVEGVGPIDAVKRSGAIIRKTWGESLVANVGLGAVVALAMVAALIPAGAGIALGVALESFVIGAVGVALSVVLMVVIGLVSSTLQVILVAALYRYAATGLVPEQFDGATLRQVFRKK
jgi:hypothetical protein